MTKSPGRIGVAEAAMVSFLVTGNDDAKSTIDWRSGQNVDEFTGSGGGYICDGLLAPDACPRRCVADESLVEQGNISG